jgi:hypothetical protein
MTTKLTKQYKKEIGKTAKINKTTESKKKTKDKKKNVKSLSNVKKETKEEINNDQQN